MPVGKMIRGILTSPDYTFRDFKAILINGCQQNRSLWKELLLLDLSPTLCNVRIPYVILQGDTDIVASTAEVQRLVDSSDNPNLKCLVVKNSGHMPGGDGMDKEFEQLCNMV